MFFSILFFFFLSPLVPGHLFFCVFLSSPSVAGLYLFFFRRRWWPIIFFFVRPRWWPVIFFFVAAGGCVACARLFVLVLRRLSPVVVGACLSCFVLVRRWWPVIFFLFRRRWWPFIFLFSCSLVAGCLCCCFVPAGGRLSFCVVVAGGWLSFCFRCRW